MDRITHTAPPPRARRRRQSRLLSVMTVFVCLSFTFLRSLMDWAEFASLNNLVVVEKSKHHIILYFWLFAGHIWVEGEHNKTQNWQELLYANLISSLHHILSFLHQFSPQKIKMHPVTTSQKNPKSTEIWHGRNAKAGSCIFSSCVFFSFLSFCLWVFWKVWHISVYSAVTSYGKK